MKSFIKSFARTLLSLFGKEFQLEYWQIKRNEKSTLIPISKFYDGFVKPGMKIIDVGANVGTYSKVFLELGAEVIGMEPQKYCQNILKIRFKDQERFKLIAAAAGPKEMKGEIHKSASHTIASMNKNWINEVTVSKRFWGEKWTEKEEIEVTTLDHVISENYVPEYLKIDVEGYELEVLKGLHTAIQIISFEITLPEMKTAAINCMNEICELGNYEFIIPHKNLNELGDWKERSMLLSQLQTLCEGSEKVSADIFCRLKQN
ncbi:MAG: FkbM family methyltransferase [bacterium]|nr:FkbM family methyltransferase [bacterium]